MNDDDRYAPILLFLLFILRRSLSYHIPILYPQTVCGGIAFNSRVIAFFLQNNKARRRKPAKVVTP